MTGERVEVMVGRALAGASFLAANHVHPGVRDAARWATDILRPLARRVLAVTAVAAPSSSVELGETLEALAQALALHPDVEVRGVVSDVYIVARVLRRRAARKGGAR